MDFWKALLAFAEKFRDFVLRPIFSLTFGFIALAFLILPKSFLAWLGLATLIEQHRGKVSIVMIVLFAVGIIRTLDVYFFPWRRQRIQREKDREIFQRRLATLAKDELLILAYCLSRNRTTYFVRYQSYNYFESAAEGLRDKGMFRQLPGNMQGYPYCILDENWPALQHFKEDILKKSEALSPQQEKEFEFYDEYQKSFGFGQVETPTQKKEIESKSESQSTKLDYALYTQDVFLDIIWKWNYKPEFGQKPINLTPHCPDCERQLVPKSDLDGISIFTDVTGKRHKRMVCPVHQKDYRIPVDGQGDYVTVMADISKKIKSGKRKEIVDRQRK